MNEEENIKEENVKVNLKEKEDLLNHSNEGIDINSIFLAYAILFFMLLVFVPKIYLSNNIYYSSKNINYLQSQKEALKNENSDLQKKLESAKFGFLTLDIDEIK